MAKLSEFDAGPAAENRVDSLWSVLQRGIDFNPDKVALIAPSQPANHLQRLVGPASSSGDSSSSAFSQVRRASSGFSAGYLLSLLLLPAPSPIDCLTWTFAQLRRASVRLGTILDENHIAPGATVLVLVPSCAEWALLLWLSALKCYTLVTLDIALLESGNEQDLQNYIEKLAPSVIVVKNQAGVIAVERYRHEVNGPFIGISLESLSEPPKGWTSMVEISTRDFPDSIKVEPVGDNLERVASILFTSGTTTGKSKGCPRTARDLVISLDPSKMPPPLKPPIALVNTKNYLGVTPGIMYLAWYTGNATVLMGDDFSPAAMISTLGICRPLAISITSPLILKSLAEHAEYSKERVKSVRFLQMVGFVMTVELLKRAQEVFPNAKIAAGYGRTGVGNLFGWPKGAPKTLPTFQGIVSTGTALPGCKFKIVDEKGRVMSRNEPGTLHISGKAAMNGYFDGVGATAFYEENNTKWHITGDCAVLDDRDQIYVLDRSANMIKNVGITIAPATVENLLMKHIKSMVVVVGISTSEQEKTPYAILDQPAQNPSKLEELVVKELGPKYRLGGIIDLQQLGLKEWPSTKVDSVDIADLKRKVTSYLSASNP